MPRSKGKSATKRRRLKGDFQSFAIFPEGAKTEKEYFMATRPKSNKVKVRCFCTGHKSSPRNILRRVERALRKLKPDSAIEIWIVIDRDSWDPADLDLLVSWARKNPSRLFLALSNPNFEYWLLLHFEDAGRLNAKECVRRVRKYFPGSGKGVDARRLTPERVSQAIERAERRDNPPCEGWPRDLGTTTVYRLAARIREAANETA